MRSKISVFLIIVIGAFLLSLCIYFIFYLRPLDRPYRSVQNDRGHVAFIVENLTERLSEISVREDFTSDLSIPLFDNGALSFHVHAMQVGQFCPLHLHPGSEEAVFIIQGRATLRSIVSGKKDGTESKEIREEVLEKNDFFFAPPGNAHEFINISDEVLACLVAHTPPFRGNLYVREEALKKSPDISVQRLSALVEKMTAAGAGEVAVAKVNALNNVECRLMRTGSPLDQNMAKGYDLVIVYFDGEASLDIRGERFHLTPTTFIGIPAGTPFSIIPSGIAGDSSLLCFYLLPV